MSFILVSQNGEDLQVNAWNWRPTLMLLRAVNALTEEDYERMGAQGCGGIVDKAKAEQIADVVTQKLTSMKPGERMRANLCVTREPKGIAVFSTDVIDDINVNELYSATYEWFEIFVQFCRTSGGFKVM
jgi:hypothetical protein